MSDQSDAKAAVREEYRRMRMQQPLDSRDEKSEQIWQHLRELSSFQSAERVYSYMAFRRRSTDRGNSPRNSGRRQGGLYSGCQPQNRATGRGPAPPVGSGADLNPFQLRGARVQEIDLFLVPGIVWDIAGYRIGFGGGYFDRLLAAARPDALRVGLAFEFQLAPQLPRETWDIPVDVLITELGLHDCQRGL